MMQLRKYYWSKLGWLALGWFELYFVAKLSKSKHTYQYRGNEFLKQVCVSGKEHRRKRIKRMTHLKINTIFSPEALFFFFNEISISYGHFLLNISLHFSVFICKMSSSHKRKIWISNKREISIKFVLISCMRLFVESETICTLKL